MYIVLEVENYITALDKSYGVKYKNFEVNLQENRSRILDLAKDLWNNNKGKNITKLADFSKFILFNSLSLIGWRFTFKHKDKPGWYLKLSKKKHPKRWQIQLIKRKISQLEQIDPNFHWYELQKYLLKEIFDALSQTEEVKREDSPSAVSVFLSQPHIDNTFKSFADHSVMFGISVWVL